MAYWNIGIDESGNFEYYSSKGKKSFVCAVITTELTESLDERFSSSTGHENSSSSLLPSYEDSILLVLLRH